MPTYKFLCSLCAIFLVSSTTQLKANKLTESNLFGNNHEIAGIAFNSELIPLLLPNSSDTVTICDGQSYLGFDSSGVYYDTLTDQFGSDSIHALYLTVLAPSVDSLNIVSPVSYISPSGQFLFQSGIYFDTIQNSYGCDSLLKINLTIDSSILGIDSTCDRSLNLIWSKPLTVNYNPPPWFQGSKEINIDSEGNPHRIVRLQDFLGYPDSIDIDPGPGTKYLNSEDGQVVIAKYDSTGNYLSSFQFGQPRPYPYPGLGSIAAYDLALDNQDNVFATGYYDEIIDFDPDTDVDTLVSYLEGSFVWEGAFLAKYDENGDYKWVHHFGDLYYNIGLTVETDEYGNSFISGMFDQGGGFWANIILAKTDSSGNILWEHKLYGNDPSYGRDIALDDSGNSYFLIDYKEGFSFDNSENCLGFPNVSGIPDFCDGGGLVTKLDSAGNFLWATDIPIENPSRIEWNPNGLIIEGAGQLHSISDSSGGPLWTINQSYSDIAVDSVGNIYATGQFTQKFDPTGNLLVTKNISGEQIWLDKRGDVFVYGNDSIYKLSKYKSSGIHISACDSFVSPSGNFTWYTSGLYFDTIYNPIGCDSVVGINLSINNSFDTLTVIQCSNYTSPSGNHIWTTSGVYHDTIPNSKGCDSIITINLTIDPLAITFHNLVDAPSGAVIFPLYDGAVVNKAQNPSFSVDANACDPSKVGYIEFYINGSFHRKESVSPYAINGDNPRYSFKTWDPPVGDYDLTFKAFPKSTLNIEPGPPLTISVKVIDQAYTLDCNGDTNGVAFIDSCGQCAGGNTGLIPNADKDTCGVCFGDNLSCVDIDCNGELAGTAFVDSCGICAGGSTGIVPNSSCLDCNGEINGTAFIDTCSICAGGNTGISPNSCLDCNGDLNGTAYLDSCNVCVGGNTGLLPNASLDTCGVCFGNNLSCSGCDSLAVLYLSLIDTDTDLAVDTLYDGYIIDRAVLDSFSIRAEVCDTSKVGSVLFFVDGGLERIENIYEYAINGNDTLGSSYYNSWPIAPGSYFLSVVAYSGENGAGTASAPLAMNIQVIAPSPPVLDCNGDTNGTAFLDSCGTCVGGNTGLLANFQMDSCGVCNGDGSSCASCGNPNEVMSLTLVQTGTNVDLAVLTNGSIIDKSVVGGFSVRADVCDDGAVQSVRFYLDGNYIKNENVPPYAIAGDNSSGYTPWNIASGNYQLKATPFSGNNGSGTTGVSKTLNISIVDSLTTPDCNGDIGGSASIDACGQCSGGNTGVIPNSTCADCNGDPNGTAYVDSCGICSAGNTGVVPNETCKDCSGVINGSASIDQCGICSGGTTGNTPDQSCSDCAGVPNGTAIVDSCGDCVLGTTGLPFNGGCNIDCAGVLDGTAFIDSCGVCVAGTTGLIPNATCTDCNGVVNGTADIDLCGLCSGGNTGNVPNASCSDCAGVPNGTASVDTCGVCSGGTTGIIPNDCGGCEPIEVIELTLVDAGSSLPIRPVNPVDTIDKSDYTSGFSLVAQVCSDPNVESVFFKLNGVLHRKENIPPYAIAGDNSANYNPWNISPGQYIVTATPYSGNNGSGITGISKVVDLTIINSPAASVAGSGDNQSAVNADGKESDNASESQLGQITTPDETYGVSLYPNPAWDQVYLVISGASSPEIAVYDVTGKLLHVKKLQTTEDQVGYVFDISGWAEGMYIVNINLDGHLITRKFSKK